VATAASRDGTRQASAGSLHTGRPTDLRHTPLARCGRMAEAARPVELQSGDTRTVTLEVGGQAVTLRQDPTSGNHGHVVWDAAGDLARYMLEGSRRRRVSAWLDAWPPE